jgi:hypothetical protein
VTEVQVSDPTSFIVACYALVWGVVVLATVLSLIELRFWARRARELEKRRAEMADKGMPGDKGTGGQETARDH